MDTLMEWQKEVLQKDAAATWNAFVKRVNATTRLPADNINLDLQGQDLEQRPRVRP